MILLTFYLFTEVTGFTSITSVPCCEIKNITRNGNSINPMTEKDLIEQPSRQMRTYISSPQISVLHEDVVDLLVYEGFVSPVDTK